MRPKALKEKLRSAALGTRRGLAFEDVFRLSALAQKRLLGTRLYRESKTIALYSSFSNEVLTEEIFERAKADGKQICYPRVVRGHARHLEFFRVDSLRDLTDGPYEIKEPAEDGSKVDTSELDLCVVPGVAFDGAGNRLGYGKGYYDRALGAAGCAIVGLAYEFQVLKGDIPLEPFDVRLTALVTSSRVLTFKRRL
ncbi:MAG: 5-formyltetrahydrofolate cyclo-ligase [Deltaproteobacteria bacterium]|nr:5-formyltetrahydrofolate cyclo-ligase [Deltaproteobacteria bacterium]